MIAQPKIRSFAEKLSSLMEKVSYFRALDERSLDRVYRLRHDAYMQEGAIEPRADLRFADAHDDDPNALIFGIELDGVLAGSIRLHVCSLAHPNGPGLDVFPDVLTPMLERDESFVDPTRFVVDATVRRATSLMPFATLRLASMAADHFRTDQILATVRIEHVPFYRRIFCLEPKSEPRIYPSLKKPIVIMSNYMADIRDGVYERYPIFSSTNSERSSLFGPSRRLDMEDAPSLPFNDNAGRRGQPASQAFDEGSAHI